MTDVNMRTHFSGEVALSLPTKYSLQMEVGR